jgi:hypothetical protein
VLLDGTCHRLNHKETAMLSDICFETANALRAFTENDAARAIRDEARAIAAMLDLPPGATHAFTAADVANVEIFGELPAADGRDLAEVLEDLRADIGHYLAPPYGYEGAIRERAMKLKQAADALLESAR